MLRLCRRQLLKTMWQKEKLLVCPFVTIYLFFSVILYTGTFINGDFQRFFLDDLKVVCCRFVKCGKGLIKILCSMICQIFHSSQFTIFSHLYSTGNWLPTLSCPWLSKMNFHLTLSHIQNICSRSLYKCLCKNRKLNYQIKLKTEAKV